MAPACAANIRECPSSTMAMARMRRACLASAVRAASARNCEILRSWRVISIADMLPAPRIIDVLHRVTFAAGGESHRSQVLRRLVSQAMTHSSRRERRTKAIAEVLAMIADAYPELAPDRLDSDREAEEWLWEIASGFCAALDRYAARTMQVKRDHY